MSVARVLGAVRITVELGAIALVTAWGLQAASGPARWLLAVACAVVLLVLWGRYVAPKSPTRLDDPARLAVEILLFVAVAFATAAVVSPAVGVGFGVLAVVDALAIRVTEPRSRATPHAHRAIIQEGS